MGSLLDRDLSVFDDITTADPFTEQKAAMSNAVRTNPDAYAKAANLAEQTNLPVDTVERNTAQIEERQRLSLVDLDKMFSEHPETQNWMKSPHNTKLVSDDFSAVGRISKTLKDIPRAFVSGQDMLEQADIEYQYMFGGQMTPEQLKRSDELYQKQQDAQFGTGGLVSDALTMTSQNLPMMGQTVLEGGAGAIAGGSAGFLLGLAIPGTVGEEVGLTGLGARYGGGTASLYENFRQQSGLVFGDIRRIKDESGKPVDINAARGASVLVGMVNAGLDTVALDKIMGTVPGYDKIKASLSRDGIHKLMKVPAFREAFTRIGTKFAKGIGAEALTEGMQEVTQIIGEEVTKAQSDGSFKFTTVPEAAERTYEAAKGGALVATTIGSVGSSAQLGIAYRNRDNITPSQVTAQVQAINENMRSGDGSVLLQRDPMAFRSLAQSVTGDERFYFDAEVFGKTIAALPPTQQELLFKAMPSLKSELIDSATTGADVSISKADYATFFAPYQEADFLAEHAKLDPEAQSVAQRRAYNEFLAKNPDMAQAVEDAAKQAVEPTLAETQKAVERIIRKSLQDAGRPSPEAKVLAPLYAANIAKMSSAVGVDPVEFFQKNVLGFQSQTEAGTTAMQGNNVDVMLRDLEQVRAGTNKRLDDATKRALLRFGERLDQSGLTIEQARTMAPDALLAQLTPQQPTEAQISQRLDQVSSAFAQNPQQMALDFNPQDVAAGLDQVAVSMSAATNSIPGIARILEDAGKGDPAAHRALQDIARSALSNLTEGIPSVIIETTPATGLYGGYVEPSLGVSVRFNPGVRNEVLSALAQFAQNFNQEQVHVRGQSEAPVGTVSPDGSYTTEAFKVGLSRPLTRQEVDRIIAESGLYGLTFADNYWEAYYVGEPENDAEIAGFGDAIKRAIAITDEIGAGNGNIESGPQNLWIYGVGSGAIPYDRIAGDVLPGSDIADENALIIARYFTDGPVKPRQQSDTITDPQRQLQRRIALDYEALPDNDMSNPLVRQAYEALRDAVIKQYKEIPLREVEAHVRRDADGNVVYDENGDPVGAAGEPYKNSAQMRFDVRKRNRMTFYATTKANFGPPGEDFTGHPLLEPTEFRDKNGYQLVVNDVLRVVHDYYAHNLTATNFGPRGEEAAWANHMTTITDPMARWALTSETRGQNSWVNFRPGAELVPKLIDRGFARQKAALLPIEYSLTGDPQVDEPVQKLIDTLTPEQQNGSIRPEARATDETIAQAYAQENTGRLMQSVTEQAQRNGIGLYSMVEKQIIDMQFPQWKPNKAKALTPEEQKAWDEIKGANRLGLDEKTRAEFDALREKVRAYQGVAKGQDIWQKVEKLPVKKEELEWLGLQEFLTSAPAATFTRNEVLDFVRSNGVQIDEIIADQEANSGEIDWGDGEVIDDEGFIDSEAEYYRDEASIGGTYEEEYIAFAKEVAEDNVDDEQTAAALEAGNDKDIVELVEEKYRDTLNEKVDEWARSRGQEAYYDNPYYRYTTDNGDALTGNDDIGWTLEFSNGKSEFLEVYSLNEAQIRANDRLIESGDYVGEDSPEAKKWESYVTNGSYQEYRERKLTLPSVDGDFYYETHFPDRNIVAFTRETDRWIAGDLDMRKARLEIEAAQDSGVARDYRNLLDVENTIKEILSNPDDVVLEPMYKGAFDKTMFRIYTPKQADSYYIQESFDSKDAAMEAIKDGSLLERKMARTEKNKEELIAKFAMERQRKKTLFIDEFQSDWHQHGRKEGYDGEMPDVEVRQTPAGEYAVYDKGGNIVRWVQDLMVFDTEEAARDGMARYRVSALGRVAQAPFKGDGWLALGLKRALVDAVEKGYERFAWADAQVLADRWSERYMSLYETQYDTKMPSIIKRLTGIAPLHITDAPELRGDGYWYIDITDKLRQEIRANSFPLFQDARGYVDFEGGLKKVITTFTSKANFSTGVHEFAHYAAAVHRYFANVARQQIAAGTASDDARRIVDDWEALKAKVGAKSDIFTVDQEEQVAKLFEVYMREGNAPSEGLRSVFSRFRDWLLKIYKDIAVLGVEIDDETRGIFDRWLSSSSEIEKVKEKASIMSQIAQSLNLDPAVQSQIMDYVASAVNTAEDKLYREMKTEQKRTETQAYKDEFAVLRVKVMEEFERKPEYALIQYMKDNGLRILEGPETNNVPTDILANQEDNGVTFVHPDVIGDMFGYKSGQELLTALRGLPSLDGAVNSETRRRMMAKYPNMIDQGRIRVEAVDAIYNDRTLLALDTMIREIGKATGDTRTNMRQFAKVMAQQQLLKMKVTDTGYAFRWDAARDKEIKNALQYARSGAPKLALMSLQKAMVNHMLFKALLKFKDTRAKAQELFDKVNQKDATLGGSMDIDFIGAARYILSKFGMAREGFDIAQWQNDIMERDPTIMRDLVALSQMVSTPGKPEKDLTVSEFLDIANSVQNVLHIARTFKKIEIEGKDVELDSIVTQLIQQLDGLPQKVRQNLSQTTMDKVAMWGRSMKSGMRRVEHWVNAIDGGYGGITRKYIWNPVDKATQLFLDEKPKWMKKLKDILHENKKRIEEPGKIHAPELASQHFNGRFRDRLELIGFLMHTGNESNLEKLLDGYGIGFQQWDAFKQRAYKDGTINAEDMKIVQSLWDLAEDIKPLAQRAHRQLYGYRFDEIEPSPVKTPFGTYRGGYWPATTDFTKVEDADIRQAKDDATGAGNVFMLPTTGRGFTKSRVDAYRRPLSTDLRMAGTHIDKVLRFAYLEPIVRQTSRIINNRTYREELQKVDEFAGRNMLNPWLQRVAQQTTEGAVTDPTWRQWSGVFRFLRSSASAQTMMLNLMNAVQNLTGLSATMYKVGPANFARAFVMHSINPMASTKRIRNLSTEMRVRQNVEDNDIVNMINDIVLRRNTAAKMKNWAIKHGYVFQRLLQNYVDNITWSAAFDQHMQQNPDATQQQAIDYADSIVRTTQASTAARDISSMEAGSPGAKLFTMFWTYFNNLGNLMTTEGRNIITESGWKGSPKLFYMYLMTFAIPMFTAELIVKSLRGDLPDDDDDDGTVLDDWLAWFGMSQARGGAAMVPIAGQTINAFLATYNDTPMDDRVSLSPIGGLLGTGVRYLGKMLNDENDYHDDSQMIRDMLTTIGLVTGFPLGQLGKPLGYIADVNEGDTQPDGIIDYARGLIAGPPPASR